MTFIARFEAKYKVNPASGCWLWVGARHGGNKAYGVIWWAPLRKPISAHVASYLHFHGPIPNGHEIRHKCNVSLCVNPDHLTTGTHYENMHDAIKAGRAARGERHGMAKLTSADVIAIRADTRLQNIIAEQYGIKQSSVSGVKRGKIWKEVPSSPSFMRKRGRQPLGAQQ